MKKVSEHQPTRVTGSYDWEHLLDLIRAEFAYMDGRIDPPSSMHDLKPTDLARMAEAGEVWVIGEPAIACVVLTPKGDALYLGKLVVASQFRGKGFARALVDLAVARAQALGLLAVELQVRVELTENQSIFQNMGFKETGRTAHPGYHRVTSITMRRPVHSG